MMTMRYVPERVDRSLSGGGCTGLRFDRLTDRALSLSKGACTVWLGVGGERRVVHVSSQPWEKYT